MVPIRSGSCGVDCPVPYPLPPRPRFILRVVLLLLPTPVRFRWGRGRLRVGRFVVWCVGGAQAYGGGAQCGGGGRGGGEGRAAGGGGGGAVLHLLRVSAGHHVLALQSPGACDGVCLCGVCAPLHSARQRRLLLWPLDFFPTQADAQRSQQELRPRSTNRAHTPHRTVCFV